MLYFTADQHFCHKNIITYCDRPFASTDAGTRRMNERIVHEHNDRVGPDDTVIHLGDLGFGVETHEWVDRLNGTKLLVMGNHDYGSLSRTKINQRFDSVFDDPLELTVGVETVMDQADDRVGRWSLPETVWTDIFGDSMLQPHTVTIECVHNPDDRASTDQFSLVAHIHDAYKFIENQLNVGVDVWHFRPVSLNRVLDYWAINSERCINGYWSTHN